MKKTISNLMGLNIKSHSDIQFIDISINADTPLFIDPCLLEARDDDWTKNAKDKLWDYFECMYQLYAQNKPDIEKFNLFQYANEVSATRLGYGSNGLNGKGTTPQGMISTFSYIPQLLKKIYMEHPIDTTLFIKNFAEDRMSDLITNILFWELNDFTISVCNSYGMPLTQSFNKQHYWNSIEHKWMPYTGESLIVENNLILLVPKWIVQERYHYNLDQYFNSVILTKLCEKESYIDNRGKIQKIFKKDMRIKTIKVSDDIFNESIKHTSQNPKWLKDYHSSIPREFRNRYLSDEKIDEIVYRTLKKSIA